MLHHPGKKTFGFQRANLQRQRANLQRQRANLHRQRANLQRQCANLQRVGRCKSMRWRCELARGALQIGALKLKFFELGVGAFRSKHMMYKLKVLTMEQIIADKLSTCLSRVLSKSGPLLSI